MDPLPLFALQYAPTIFLVQHCADDRLHGLQTCTEAHRELQLLCVQEEEVGSSFCESLDSWEHPVKIGLLGRFAQKVLIDVSVSADGCT